MKLRTHAGSENRKARQVLPRLRLSPVLGLRKVWVGAILALTVQGASSAGSATSAAAADMAVTPNLPSGQLVGTSIIRHALAPGLKSPVYRFTVTPTGGPARMVRDFSTASTVNWTPMHEGRFTISAVGGHIVMGDMAVVLDADFQVVWTWDSFDHLTLPDKYPAGTPSCIVGKSCALPNADAYDWTHANGLSWSPNDDDLAISFRNIDVTVKVEYENGRGNGRVVWRLGKDDDFTIKSADPSPWFTHQHNATYVTPDTIVLFDNGNVRCSAGKITGCESRGQVYKLNEPQRVATLVLNVKLGSFRQALGSAQALPNGNYTFAGGYAPPSAEAEFRPNGTKVYELDTSTSEYRAYRLSALSF